MLIKVEVRVDNDCDNSIISGGNNNNSDNDNESNNKSKDYR